jgi:competence protein ComFC
MLLALFKNLGFLVLTVLFPPFCVHCGTEYSWLCYSCSEKLEFLKLPLAQQKNSSLESLQAVLEYSKICHDLLHTLKYPGAPVIATVCADILHQASSVPPVECVTWVPIHNKRKLKRGFNQSELLAKNFAQFRSVPTRELLIKVKHTSQQARATSQADRSKNIVESISPLPALIAHPPRSVLLIDDVVTTGATLEECARILIQNGVHTVHGLALAHGQ